MEMDLDTAIIGGISIAISALPFIIMNRSRIRRKKKYLQTLAKMAILNNGQLDQTELFDSFKIGIDKTKNLVFFYRQTIDKVTEHIVDLSEIQSCKVINSHRIIKTKDGNQKVIDKLELSFIPKATNNPELKMEFFNADEDPEIYGELQSIEKWSKLINDHLKLK